MSSDSETPNASRAVTTDSTESAQNQNDAAMTSGRHRHREPPSIRAASPAAGASRVRLKPDTTYKAKLRVRLKPDTSYKGKVTGPAKAGHYYKSKNVSSTTTRIA
jgi:hypothetical protein